MKNKSVGIDLPSLQEIEKWNDIDEFPIVGTAPRTIPEITLIQSPVQDDYNNYPALTSALPASLVLTSISLIDKVTKTIKKHISNIYQLRSKTRGLENEIKSKNIPFEKYSPIAQQMLNDMTADLKAMKEDCEHTIQQISAILYFDELYDKGNYCAELIDRICYLIFLLLSLGSLCPTRNALSDDFSVLTSLTRNPSNPAALWINQDFVTIRQWISSPNAIRGLLMDNFSKVAKLDLSAAKKILLIFWKHIKNATIEEKFIYADQETAYTLTLMLLLDFYSLKKSDESAGLKEKDLKKLNKKDTFLNDIYDYIKKMRTLHPAIVLYNESNVGFDEMIKSENLSARMGELTRPIFHLNGMVNDLKTSFSTFSNDYSLLITPEKPNDEVVSRVIKSIPIVFRKINKSIHTLREFILDKHDHAKERPTDISSTPNQENDNSNESQENNNSNKSQENNEKIPKSKFELAMKYEITDEEREAIMQILTICRSFRELISDELPKLNQIFSKYIQDRIQEFSRDVITRALDKSKCISDELNKIRDLITYDFSSSSSNITADSKSKTPVKCPPHISLILLLRAQLQIFLNPESPTMTKGLIRKAVDGTDSNNFEKFIKESTFYINILQLQKNLSKVCDQSSLYFKESYLDLYRNQLKGNKNVKGIVYFPITASLPYTLINFVLQNSSTNQVMLGSLFYPLSIYDDAAAKAVYELQSKYLYGEIVSECQICVLTIVKLITDSAFHMVEDACVDAFTMKYNNDTNKDNETKEKTFKNKNSLSKITTSQIAGTPFRIASFLQQNKLFLIGQHFDIKSAISQRLSELFMENLRSAFSLVEKYGLLTIHAFARSLDIFRDIHEMFVKEGHSIDSFDILLQTTIKTYTPNSFYSALLNSVYAHAEAQLIPTFLFSSSPCRFIPCYGSDTEQKVVKAIKKRKFIPSSLRQTITFITVDHIKEFFNLVKDDGAYDMFINMIKSSIDSIFPNFCDKYREVTQLIKRIADTPIGTGCHKAYEHFEGAYRSFASDKQVDLLFESMKSFGNLISLVFMCDIAFFLKHSEKEQVLAYLTEASYVKEKGESSETEITTDMIFDLFESGNESTIFKKSRSFFNSTNNDNGDLGFIKVAPDTNQINYPFLQSFVNKLSDLVHEEWDLFDEKSPNILDITSMNGFAAVWSVLEFVFCLKEVYRGDENNKYFSSNKGGSFAVYGEGVLTTAALMLCLTGQVSLAKILSIGTRIIQQKKIDLAAIDEDILNRFVNIFKLVNASIENTVTTLTPTLNSNGTVF